MDATYDRELIAEMLAAAAHGGIHLFAMDAVMGQIAALRAADNRDAAGVDSEEDAYVIDPLAHLLAGDAQAFAHGVVGAGYQRQAALGGGDQGTVKIVKRHGLLRS